MSSMRAPRRFAAAALLGLASPAVLGLGGAKPDPWDLPAPDPAEISIAITASKREYVIRLVDRLPDRALLPERVEPPATEDEKKALRECRDLLAAGRGTEAETAAKELLRLNPALHDARAILGKALLAQKKTAEAVAALRESLIGNRRNPEAWKDLEEAAAALGKKVVRPALQPPSWLLETKRNEAEIGVVAPDEGGPAYSWIYYAMGRAFYRFEGPFDAAYPGRTYVPTFREHLHGVGAVVVAAEGDRKDGEKLPADLARLLAEKKAKTIVPFVFFAMYADPVPAEPEKDFAVLRPRLEKHFDEKILVKK